MRTNGRGRQARPASAPANAAPPRDAPATAAPLLEVEGVSFSYGPLQVLFDVGITVPPGGRVALLGTNGAGKSTLLRVIGGLLSPSAGAVRYRGVDITRLRAEQRVRLGLTLVEGGRATFPSLTVAENLRLGAYPFLADRARVEEGIEEVLTVFPALHALLHQQAATLSGGEQQMMALARALLARPELLLVDELSLGLAPVVMAELLRAVEELARRGTAILLVEQSLNIALGVVEHAYFMEKGEVRFSGPAADLLERGDLVRSVFFGEVAGARP